ncbi:elongation of very long chain fatty acids protein 7-like isoform X2 [Zootermopsis nevadensis]|uniref:elongation of very long chain fatty acids protein 7-like isoform X2 n=1 Tax=Zootermopsis nevadensis TaxID=136037 RepID=UPI000B8EC9F8|nr:elongation of very long chain fatty acids protein 7-like isoform X2 [Zootermopsis nevadensis]
MAALIIAGKKAYEEWVLGKMDHRSDELFLMSSIWSPVAVIGLYLYFVKCVGPRHMKNRPAYELNGVMKAYNLTQILCSVYMLLYSLKAGWAFKYKWLCEPVDYSFTASSIDVVRCVWTYMMIKLLDLVDTVFFVLRKKAAHTSFLHVYHHAIVFFGAWCCTKYVPGPVLDRHSTLVHGSVHGRQLQVP